MPELKLRPTAMVHVYSPTKQLADHNFIAHAVWDCLKRNDYEGAFDILDVHLRALQQAKPKIPRSTTYHDRRTKKPTLKTFAKMVHAAEQQRISSAA
jgi:hypothetical protein